MFEQRRRIVRLHETRVQVDERGGRRDHHGQRHDGRDHGIGPADEVGQSHGHGDHGTERQNDGSQRAQRAVHEQHQRHQENPEKRHELARGTAGFSLKPGIEPRAADAPDGAERAARLLERQQEGVNGCQCPVAFRGRAHAQFQRDPKVVFPHQAGAPKERCPHREGPGARGLIRGDAGG